MRSNLVALAARGLVGLVLAMAITGTSAQAASTVAAVSPAPGRIDLFQRDASSGELEHATWDEATGSWSSWASLGELVNASSNLAAVTRSEGALDVFFLDAERRIRRKSFQDGWRPSVVMSPRSWSSGPTAVYLPGAGRVEVLGRNDSDGNLLRMVWRPSSDAVYLRYSNLFMAPGTTPAAAPGGGSVLDVVIARNAAEGAPRPYAVRIDTARDASDATDGVNWDLASVSTLLPGRLVGSPSMTSLTTGAVQIVARDEVGGLVRLVRPAGASAWATAWAALPAPPLGASADADPVTLRYVRGRGRVAEAVTVTPGLGGRQFSSYADGWGWRVGSPTPGRLGAEPVNPGTIRYFGRTGAHLPVGSTPTTQQLWASWLGAASVAEQRWLGSKMWRLHVFSPEFDRATTWFAGGMLYWQLYTIDAAAAAAHPSWVMRNGLGEPLYVGDGQYTQLAGNIFNAEYREYAAQALLGYLGNGAYRGVWLDNVNIELAMSGLVRRPTAQHPGPEVGGYGGEEAHHRVYAPNSTRAGDGQSVSTCPTQAPVSPEGLPITDACWARGIADFVEELRDAVPAGTELLTNTPWFHSSRDPSTWQFFRDASGGVIGGLGQPTATNPRPPAERIAAASTYADLEGGFWGAKPSGPGVGGAAGRSGEGYSLDQRFRYVDALHAQGRGAVIDFAAEARYLGESDDTPAATVADNRRRVREFQLAGYLLTTTGVDGIGEYDRTNGENISAWPMIPGTTRGLYELQVGTPASLPAGAVPVGGIGNTSRGVVGATSESTQNRLWVRRFVRGDGEVFVVLNEAAYAGSGSSGERSYAIPATGCRNLTRPTEQPGYASLNPATSLVTLAPEAATVVFCDGGQPPPGGACATSGDCSWPLATRRWNTRATLKVPTLFSTSALLNGAVETSTETDGSPAMTVTFSSAGRVRLSAMGSIPLTADISVITTPAASPMTSVEPTAAVVTSLKIRLAKVYLFGAIPMATTNCQTSKYAPVGWEGRLAQEGGSLASTFAISNMTGCGALNGLVSSATAGVGNSLALELFPVQ